MSNLLIGDTAWNIIIDHSKLPLRQRNPKKFFKDYCCGCNYDYSYSLTSSVTSSIMTEREISGEGHRDSTNNSSSSCYRDTE